jgi:peptide-methionine (S)-S-oxide reductase
MGDHTEVFQVDFDPAQLSYAQLLDEIWANRRGGRSYSRQYMEAVFPANAEQERVARERVGERAPIVAGAQFYLAEDYHQKYHLRHDSVLMHELAAYTPRQLTDSTIAARLNGFVAARGSRGKIVDELPRFGLSRVALEHLLQLAR